MNVSKSIPPDRFSLPALAAASIAAANSKTLPADVCDLFPAVCALFPNWAIAPFAILEMLFKSPVATFCISIAAASFNSSIAFTFTPSAISNKLCALICNCPFCMLKYSNKLLSINLVNVEIVISPLALYSSCAVLNTAYFSAKLCKEVKFDFNDKSKYSKFPAAICVWFANSGYSSDTIDFNNSLYSSALSILNSNESIPSNAFLKSSAFCILSGVKTCITVNFANSSLYADVASVPSSILLFTFPSKSFIKL